MKRFYIVLVAATVGGLLAIALSFYPESRSSIRIGYAISLSGPYAPGVGITTLPNYRLWAKEVNEAGGIMVKSLGKRLPVEIIEYDDRSLEHVGMEAVKQLIEEDRVDFILPPWGTGMNLAVAPLLHEAGYPHLAITSLTLDPAKLVRKWPNSFWLLGDMDAAAAALVKMIEELRSQGKIGNRVAVVNVADRFGVDFADAARRRLVKRNFKIVYDRSYPVGAQDVSDIIAAVKQLDPDSFLAFSYPPDTMAITEESRALAFNPKIFYTAVGTAFPSYKKRFGVDAEGVMGTGGWNPDTPESEDYRRRHMELTGREPDRWASPVAYASLQMLKQAIERAGTVDRAAVVAELQDGTFQTVLGDVKLSNNVYVNGWMVGQWQNGEYHGIEPATLPGAQEIMFPKPPWDASS